MKRQSFFNTVRAFGLTLRWSPRDRAAQSPAVTGRRPRRNTAADRRGSTLVIVVALLGMLTLLGILTYTITSQEEVSAEYFADASKVTESFAEADLLFDHALRQLIIGTEQNERHSVLHGGRASLLPTMFGRDLQPFSGMGVTLGWNTGSNTVYVDQDLDGSSDNSHLLEMNTSPVAQGSIPDMNSSTAGYPDPDVDYTYPDINSPWLGLRAEVPDSSNNGTVPVVIPSFHRPQYLRSLSSVPASQWYTSSTTRDRVFRAHKEHKAVASDGTVTNVSRYVLTQAEATSLSLSGPFPFPDSADNPSGTNEGVWNGGEGNATSVQYDADADGDNIKEAVWLDLDYPVQENASGELYVPMFAISVYDADALLNLNTSGNLAGNIALNGNPFGGNRYTTGADGAPGLVNIDDNMNGIVDDEGELGLGDDLATGTAFISRSNLGLNPSEINPQWGLTASTSVGDPTTTFLQHRLFFGHNPASAEELSNMEWYFLTTGRAEFSSGASSTPADTGDIVGLINGRYGEPDRITSGISSRNPASFPQPGKSFPYSSFSPVNPAHITYDDNLNYGEGGSYDGSGLMFPTSVSFPAWEHPLDLHGSGRISASGAYGRQRLMYESGQHQYPAYYGYITAPTVKYRTYGGGLMQGDSLLYQVDDVEETFYEPSIAAQQGENDAIFGVEEMSGLHLTDSDQAAVSVTSRLQELAPVNFRDGTDAESRRLRFTTSSWDLKTFGKPYYGSTTGADKFRRWEFNADFDADSNPEFPPQFGGTVDPFRSVVRNLLTLEPRESNLLGLQRRLSLNHIVDRSPQDGRLRFRPLTPHPTSLGNTPVTSGPSSPEYIGTSADQEYLARVDRQNLCRDIYVMLYLLGGGEDNKDYTGTNDPGSGSSLYTHTQLEAMAQFAVNWVDALDPDEVITMFAYDKNLGDGWNIDSYYYDNTTLPNANDTSVGIVYGVEAQQLALSEVMAVIAKRVETMGIGQNHDATEYDDTQHRDFLYIELENVSPRAVTFDTEGWQIVVRPSYTGGETIATEERRLTFTSLQSNLSGGSSSRFTIGTAGDEDNKDGSTVRSSFIRVNPTHAASMGDIGMQTIVPKSGSLDADLLKIARNRYRVEQAPTSGQPGNGPKIDDSGAAPAPGTDLFHVEGTDTAKDGLVQGELTFDIEIRRRINLGRTRPVLHDSAPVDHVQQSRDNRYVVVDKQEDVAVRLLALESGDNVLQIPNKLQQLESRERDEPLSRTTVAGTVSTGGAAATYQYNSLGLQNVGSPSTFTLWQPHFNRDFYSAAELLSLPIYGPDELTSQLKDRKSESNAVLSTAANIILQPDNRTNRWYRLFEFFNVPSRTHRHTALTPTGNLARSPAAIDIGRIMSNPDLGFYRVPGRLQLNTMRHPHALAALLDDPDVAELGTVGLPDKLEGFSNRDWWYQFLGARDGQDPISGLLLPGLPYARPFRSFNLTSYGAESIEHTLLRTLPADSSETDPRRLFELGTHGNHTAGSIEQSFRHRLLAKMLSNTTNRSNVFVVFVQVDFFEAARDSSSGSEVVRIGAKRSDSPGYRSMFVVDRSKALELLGQQHLPRSFTDSADSTSKFNFNFNRSFSYRSLVTHEQRIR